MERVNGVNESPRITQEPMCVVLYIEPWPLRNNENTRLPNDEKQTFYQHERDANQQPGGQHEQ